MRTVLNHHSLTMLSTSLWGNQNGSHVIWIGLYFWLIIDLNMFWERSWRSIFYEIWSRNDVHSERHFWWLVRSVTDSMSTSVRARPRLSNTFWNSIDIKKDYSWDSIFWLVLELNGWIWLVGTMNVIPFMVQGVIILIWYL